MSIPDRIQKPPPLSIIRTIYLHLDLVGFALLAPSAIQLLLALQWGGNDYAWNSSTVIGLFCGAGATFLVWLAWNYHSGDGALIPASMATKQAVWSSSLCAMWIYTTQLLSAFFIPLYFQAVKDATPSQSGVDDSTEHSRSALHGCSRRRFRSVLPPALLSPISWRCYPEAIFFIFIFLPLPSQANQHPVSKTGYTIPYVLIATMLTAVGSGLLSRLGPASSTLEWAGFQVCSRPRPRPRDADGTAPSGIYLLSYVIIRQLTLRF